MAGNIDALENARRIQREKNETKKSINGRLQEVVEHGNGRYVMVGENNDSYVYYNTGLRTFELIDKGWSSFPSNEQFGMKTNDHCFSSLEQAGRKYPVSEWLFADWKEKVKRVNS